VRYVALGDSYTIGTSVTPAESWPSQLVARLPQLELVANLGVNGYSSDDVIRYELPALASFRPEFVTLQIGVNDVVRGVPEQSYQANVARIVDAMLVLVSPDRMVCVATPDYTVTPQGTAFGSPSQRAGIERVNAILSDACERRGVLFVPETFAISQAAATDRSLVAGDGLHPYAVQYARWVDAIEPALGDLLLPSGNR